MKNLLFVSVALSVFTVTSNSASAQRRVNYLKDMTLTSEGIVYTPPVQTVAMKAVKAVSNTRNLLSPTYLATELCSRIQFKYAQLLNREVESIADLGLFNFIEEWWATRYRFGGTTKKVLTAAALPVSS